jgi:D-alanyl-D-alanine carboxypeptidase (penicillin-binding protein 5/6)
LPLLVPESTSIQLAVQTPDPQLVWPATGQSAVGIVGSQVLDTHGAQKPVPTASTAKVITALTVLHAKPLTLGLQGPVITLTANDAALYNAYAAQDGSLVVVQAGEQISEYQMLEAMLLPSANNMADSLATWAFGSLPAYAAAANKYVQGLGLAETHIGSDASGFSPTTTSTAHDLVRIGELAMQNPVLTQIVSQSTASGIPIAGTIRNTNSLLGTSNIIGIKTGNTPQAGGVFISASRTIVNGRPITIVTALAGASTLAQAMQGSLPLIQSAQINFRPVTVMRAGSIVGNYRLPWGGTVSGIINNQLAVNTWNGDSLPATIKLKPIPAMSPANRIVGNLTVPKSAFANSYSVLVTLSTAPTKPSLWWRLLHPF